MTNKIFIKCAEFGDDIIHFLKRSKWHALLIFILCFVTPVNLIMWGLMICSLYKKRAL